MSDFTLRVELLGTPSQKIYANLHARMKAGGFLQTVSGTNNAGQSLTTDLPHATYYVTVNSTAATVRDWAQAQAQAKEAWGKSVVFVAQMDTWAWGKS